ncbi:MAG: PadR family transcriptional regulator [Dehalococcoidia bacterium]|jgi:DNA-binding PadR family transcriptional regulator
MHGHRFGHGPWMGRMFRKGDFKYVILDMLKDKPRHGYEIIRELEGQFGGLYVPSAGIVYPTLQYLEELGYVSAAEQDAKKVYTITDEGRKFLDAQKVTVDGIRDHIKDCGFSRSHHEFHDLMHDIGRITRLCAGSGWAATPDDLKKIRKIVDDTYEDIDKILKR